MGDYIPRGNYIKINENYEGYLKDDLWNKPKLKNICIALNNNNEFRKIFLNRMRGALQDSGLGTIDSPQTAASINMFVSPSVSQGYTENKFQKCQGAFTSAIRQIFVRSFQLKHIIKFLLENDILESSDSGKIFFCKNCNELGFGNHTNKHKPKIYSVYKIPQEILINWWSSPGKFLEGMVYWSLKNLDGLNLYPNFEYSKKGKKDIHGEVDVFIQPRFGKFNFDNGYSCDNLGIFCTISDSSSERKQTEKIDEIKIRSIFISTQVGSGVKSIKTFKNVSKDSRFPNSLRDYVKGLLI